MKKSLFKLVLILILAVGTALAGVNDYGQVAGRITASDQNSPVSGVIVELKPSGLTAKTAEDGSFVFKQVPVGSYTLVIHQSGFMSVKRMITVQANQTTELSISMTVNRPTDQDRLDSAAGKFNGISKDELRGINRYNAPVSITSEAPVIFRSEKKRTTSKLDDSKGTVDDILGQVNGLTATAAGETYLRGGRAGEVSYYIEPDVTRLPGLQEPQGMFFRNYGTNSFVDTRYDRLSTFALDVDDGSYNIAKEYLERSIMPPADAIRVEEFINHFDYGYANPKRGSFRLFTELVNSPYDQDVTFLKIGVKAREETNRERKPLNLTFVIDVSGSMNAGGRLQLVKQSLGLLLDQLNKHDRVAIVAYGSTARVVLPTTSATHQRQIMKAVNSLYAGGSTFAEAGLKLGFKLANQSYNSRSGNRVILCSDGVANVGQVSPDAIMAQISEFARQGITLSTFGYGMGNYNDVLLEQLAIQGDGRYAYVNDMAEAKRLFVEQFVDNMSLLARDTKIQVDFNPNVVASYRLVGYENRAVADNKFRDNLEDGGEIGPGHEVTAIYELRLKSRGRSWFGLGKRRVNSLGTVSLRWINPDQTEVSEISREISFSDRTKQFESARPELRLAIVGTKFAELLKQTSYSRSVSFDRLLVQAERIDRKIANAQTAELARLIRKASDLTGEFPWDDDDNNYRAEW